MTLLNNNKRNITNKSAINRSLMQIKQDYSSSFSEVNTSEEDDHIANSTKNEEFFNNPNSYLIETKNNPFENEILKIKQSNDNPPPIPKVPKLFLNTSIGNIQNIAPLKKNNTTQSYSLEKNLSLQISMPNNTQINQTIIDETNIHLPLENTTNSPKIFNKTMEKFKCFLNDNEQNKKKIFEKYQNIDGIQFKKYEKKNLSALFNKEDKEQEEQNHKHTTEALIKKNHELQMENYNLRKCLNVEKNFFNSKFKKLYDVIKLHIDKNLDARSKFDLADIDFLTEVLDKYINKGLNFETKEKVLHQFDNLRDYYRVNKYTSLKKFIKIY